VIYANCAAMHVNPRDLTWWEYTALLTGWNAMHADASTDGPSPEKLDKLRRFNAAHGVGAPH
jgi:hypothetical protein